MPGVRVAVLGGGVSGCSSALQLSKLGYCVSLFEMGRGCGGRASTRRTRSQPNMAVNHGTPSFDVRTDRGCEIVEGLETAGYVKEYSGVRGILSAANGFKKIPVEPGTHFVGCSPGDGGGMSGACEGLLQEARKIENPVDCHYGKMVHTLVPTLEKDGTVNGWSLFDKDGSSLGGDGSENQEGSDVGLFDWLVVAGSGIAHPRWKKTFGYDAPLLAAVSKLETSGRYTDDKLKKSLKAIAAQDAKPCLVAMAYAAALPGEKNENGAASQWDKALPFDLAWVLEDEVVQKVSVQRDADGHGGIALCVHSTAAYAREATATFGKTSTAARVGGANTSAEIEAEQISTITAALEHLLRGDGCPAEISPSFSFTSSCTWGPHLHRWGNCEPTNDALAAEDAVAPQSRVAFCGDYVETGARMGSVEAALLSGDLVAHEIHEASS